MAKFRAWVVVLVASVMPGAQTLAECNATFYFADGRQKKGDLLYLRGDSLFVLIPAAGPAGTPLLKVLPKSLFQRVEFFNWDTLDLRLSAYTPSASLPTDSLCGETSAPDLNATFYLRNGGRMQGSFGYVNGDSIFLRTGAVDGRPVFAGRHNSEFSRIVLMDGTELELGFSDGAQADPAAPAPDSMAPTAVAARPDSLPAQTDSVAPKLAQSVRPEPVAPARSLKPVSEVLSVTSTRVVFALSCDKIPRVRPNLVCRFFAGSGVDWQPRGWAYVSSVEGLKLGPFSGGLEDRQTGPRPCSRDSNPALVTARLVSGAPSVGNQVRPYPHTGVDLSAGFAVRPYGLSVREGGAVLRSAATGSTVSFATSSRRPSYGWCVRVFTDRIFSAPQWFISLGFSSTRSTAGGSLRVRCDTLAEDSLPAQDAAATDLEVGLEKRFNVRRLAPGAYANLSYAHLRQHAGSAGRDITLSHNGLGVSGGARVGLMVTPDLSINLKLGGRWIFPVGPWRVTVLSGGRRLSASGEHFEEEDVKSAAGMSGLDLSLDLTANTWPLARAAQKITGTSR